MSSIYYIEDIDSLRFALSIFDEFNLKNLQPHFPGYPVFCFLGSIIYMLTGSLASTFSIIGSIATFIIIYFSVLLTGFKEYSWQFYILILLLLINPMLWLMSNRYMPDLLGLSIAIASFYMLTSKKSENINMGSFLFGILLGTRLSYFPLLIIPYFRLFMKGSINNFLLVSSMLAGCLIWLVPMIWITGIESLVNIAQNQTVGHFSDFGGTIVTENSWQNRIKFFVHTIWSDGLGGYWLGRSASTLWLSLFMIPMIILACQWISKDMSNNKRIKILFLSIVIYSLWALYFQNIIYKSRHIMPIVYFIIILISLGQIYISNNKKYLKVFTMIFLLLLSIVSSNLIIQHKNPTAIAKIRDELNSIKQPVTILSNPLINYYLESTGFDGEFISIESKNIIQKINQSINSKKVLMIGDYHHILNNHFIINTNTTYYHNPYVNRMWSTIKTYIVHSNE
tara:strand:+ start:1295 stop:2653 length:1359 start_codon:yes stop_codon:yes gene_type:complete